MQYGAIRIVTVIVVLIAFVVLAVSVIGLFAGLIALANGEQTSEKVLLSWNALTLSSVGLLLGLVLLALCNLIYAFLDIAINTHEIVDLLKAREDRETANDSATKPLPGGSPDEPKKAI